MAGGGPKRSSGVSCLRSDGVLLVRSGHSMPVLWGVKGDAWSTFPASSWGFVAGLKHGRGVKGDALSTFPASTWGPTRPRLLQRLVGDSWSV